MQDILYEAPGVAETGFSETVPLLGGAAATGGTAGAGGVSTSTVVGGLTGAGAILGGGGALFKYLKDNNEEDEDHDFDDPRDKKPSEHKKPTISVDSEHNYLGPGNSVLTGNDPLPVSDADRIAYNHDLNYVKAKTDQDIIDADSAAISEFVNKAKEGDWRSALGAGGLQIKQTIESVIGRQYPPLEKGKLWVNIILIKILEVMKPFPREMVN